MNNKIPQQNMSKSVPQQFYIRKLVKIIHQKEKQLNQYRSLVKKNRLQSNKFHHKTNELNVQTHESFQFEMTQNRQFIKQISHQIQNMGSQILQLKNELLQEENKSVQQEDKINELIKQLNNSKHEINALKRQNDIQNAHLQNVNRMKSTGQNQFAMIKVQLSRSKLQISNLKQEKEEWSEFLQQIYKKMNIMKNEVKERRRKVQQLQFFVRESKNKKPEDTIVNNLWLISKIMLQLIEDNALVSEGLAERQQALNNRIKELEQIEAFELKSLNESIHGLSKFIKSHTHLQASPSQQDIEQGNQGFQSSLFRKQEDQLLKQLEQEMKKEYSHEQQAENQKLVELSQFRQTLQATKQVNKQLFTQNMHLDNIMGQCRILVNKLYQSKVLKAEHKEEFYRIFDKK